MPLAELKVISIALKTVRGMDGAGVGSNRWEGQTDQDLKVVAERRTGVEGYSVVWEYHDGKGELHQHRKDSVTTKDLPGVVKEIRDHAANSYPNRFVEPTQDPVIAAARRMTERVQPEPDHPVGAHAEVDDDFLGAETTSDDEPPSAGTVDPVLATHAMWRAEQAEKEEEERLMAELEAEQQAAGREKEGDDVDPHVEAPPRQ